jgi:catechol 2,3-dioxygenase-like lactoylglutathione lyase family enzyme
MSTIDHVTIRVADLDAARRFYDRVFALLKFAGERTDGVWGSEWDDFSISPADSGHPRTTGLHVGFGAESREQIDAWWRALTAAGFRDDGAPGVRPQYSDGYYGAFVRDLDDNSVEAVEHESTHRASGLVDHLWVRVADLEPVRRFYLEVAPALGLRARDLSDRVTVIAEGATCSFLEGPPTENLHLAFGVADTEAVARFHHAALAAGGRDNGAPGARPEYHPGYYGAYILDPGGTNLEAVFHDRS